MRTPLMPIATAVWLVDNTSLTFEQIAEFCRLHVLEVKGIADGDVAHGIKGMDPISSGQLTREEIAKAEQDSSYLLKLAEPKVEVPETGEAGEVTAEAVAEAVAEAKAKEDTDGAGDADKKTKKPAKKKKAAAKDKDAGEDGK